MQRVFMVADGTVTQMMESYLLQPVDSIVFGQQARRLEIEDHWLVAVEGTEVCERRVVLRGRRDKVPYLHADAGALHRWRGRLAGVGPAVGLCWQGNPDFEADRHRSPPLSAYRQLGTCTDVRFVSLQKNHGLDQLRCWRRASKLYSGIAGV